MTDQLKNKYYFQNAIINFKNNEMIGDDIKIDFSKTSFGNLENDPRLRGNYLYSDGNQSQIKKEFLQHVKKGKIAVLPGNLRLKKLNMINLKKLSIIRMHG